MRRFLIETVFTALAFALPNTSQAQQVLKVGCTCQLPPPLVPVVMTAVAADANMPIEFQFMSFGDLLPALAAKKIDIVASNVSPKFASAASNAAWSAAADFTQVYYSFRDAIVVPVSDPRTYNTTADFTGMTVVAPRGTIYVDLLSQIGAKVIVVDSTPLGLPYVEDGRAGALITSKQTIGSLVKRNAHPKLKIVDTYTPFAVTQIALAVQKGNTDLLNKLNASLTKLKADGTIKALDAIWGVDYVN